MTANQVPSPYRLSSLLNNDLHPLFACCIHYIVVIASSIAVNDYLLIPLASHADQGLYPSSKHIATTSFDKRYLEPFTISNIFQSQCHQPKTLMTQIGPQGNLISWFLLSYVLCILICRLAAKHGALRMAVFYEYTWLCNSTLLLGFIGLRTCRPLLVTGPAIAVSIDQVLWYVDLIGWSTRCVVYFLDSMNDYIGLF
jgi:hypothetical protein